MGLEYKTLDKMVGNILIIATICALGFFGYKKYCKEDLRSKTARTKEILKITQEEIEKSKREYPGEYPDNLNRRDGWGNSLNYRVLDGKFFGRKERTSKGTRVVYNSKHYELSSSGPDGIPQTRDDIQAWYTSGHEWNSHKRLERLFQEEMNKPLFERLHERF